MNDIDIENIKSYLDSQPIEKAWLFGSYARGNYNNESDVDLLIKFEPSARIGLFTFSKIVRDLEEISQKKVDLVVEGTFYPWVEESVSKEKILIYERNS